VKPLKNPHVAWEKLDWAALDRLRAAFLSGKPGGASYWTSRSDLSNYDFTYGQRIGWKWDAVLRELKLRGWTPPSGHVLLDWGCGSGVAGRRVLEFFGADKFAALRVFDRSSLAMEFASEGARQAFPKLPVEFLPSSAARQCRNQSESGERSRLPLLPPRKERGGERRAFGLRVGTLPKQHERPLSPALSSVPNGGEGVPPGGAAERGVPILLVVSHVLNELDEAGGRALRQAIDGADAVLWVEPGTHADSRALIAMRESLRENSVVIAPCTHQAACGLLAAGNERHWCHNFAAPPAGIMADANWVRFAQRAGIDLRSLPYSFLVLERRGLREPLASAMPEGVSRIIGQPRLYKGYAKVFSCQEDGVRDLTLQKRDAPELFKELKAGRAPALHRWTLDGKRSVDVKAIAEENTSTC